MSRLSGYNVRVGGVHQLNGAVDQQAEARRAIEQIRERALEEASTETTKIIAEARTEAQQILEAARAKAAQLVQEAESQRDNIQREAYDVGEKAGFEKGYQDGHDALASETMGILEGAQELLDKVYLAEKRILNKIRPNAVGLISQVATDIVGHAIETRPEILVDVVERAIESLHLTSSIRVVLSADLLGYLRRTVGGEEALKARYNRLEWVPDNQLAITEVYLLSEEGNFNLTPLAQIEKKLSPALREFPLPRDVDESEVDASDGDEDGAFPEEELRNGLDSLGESESIFSEIEEIGLDDNTALETPKNLEENGTP